MDEAKAARREARQAARPSRRSPPNAASTTPTSISAPSTKTGDGRSRRRRRRLRAQGRRGQRAGQGPLRHRHRAGRSRSSRPRPSRSRRSRPRSSSESRPSAPRARSPTCSDKIEDERARRRDARRGRQEARPHAAHHRRGRPPGRDAGRQAGRRPAEGRRRARRAFTADVGVENEPLQLPGRRLSSGSRSTASRRRANARSTRSRTRSRRAGATTRSPTRLKAKADRDRSTSSRPARRSPRSPRPTSSRSRRRPASSAAAPPPALPPRRRRRRCSAPPKDGAGSAEGKDADRAHRVPRHRHHGAAASMPNRAEAKQHRRRAAPRASPTTCWRNTSRGCRTTSAPPSIRTRCSQVTGGGSRELSSSCRSSRRPRPSPRATRRGEPQVVWTTLVADLETPVSAFLKIAGGRPMSFLLESVEGGAVRGRYSIIGLDPDLVWRTNGTRAEINRAARSKPDALRALPRAAARGAARADRRKPHRRCPTSCRRWRPACSAISATTWCG